MIIFPPLLPLPTPDYSADEESSVAGYDLSGGLPELEKVTNDTRVTIKVKWVLTAYQYESFLNFWKYDISGGSKPFWIKVRSFIEEPEPIKVYMPAQPVVAEKIGTSRFWSISAVLYTRNILDDQLDDADLVPVADSTGLSLSVVGGGTLLPFNGADEADQTTLALTSVGDGSLLRIQSVSNVIAVGFDGAYFLYSVTYSDSINPQPTGNRFARKELAVDGLQVTLGTSGVRSNSNTYITDDRLVAQTGGSFAYANQPLSDVHEVTSQDWSVETVFIPNTTKRPFLSNAIFDGTQWLATPTSEDALMFTSANGYNNWTVLNSYSAPSMITRFHMRYIDSLYYLLGGIGATGTYSGASVSSDLLTFAELDPFSAITYTPSLSPNSSDGFVRDMFFLWGKLNALIELRQSGDYIGDDIGDTIVESVDGGATWTVGGYLADKTPIAGDSFVFNLVSIIGNTATVFGKNRLRYSTDGITWVAVDSPFSKYQERHLSTKYHAGKAYATFEAELAGAIIRQTVYESVDGINWNETEVYPLRNDLV